jgi:PAS domain S-box-containing protein
VPRDVAPAADREYFLALLAPEAPDVHVSQVYRGRLNGAVFFAVSRRQTLTGNADIAPGAFDGIVNVAAHPNLIADNLQTLATHAEDVLSLIRTDGEVLSRNIGLPNGQRIPNTTPYMAAIATGNERAFLEQVPVFATEPYFFALRRIDGWPVYASAGRPRGAIVSDWRAAVVHQMAIGVPATGALLLLTVMLRHSQRVTAAQSIRLHALFDNDAVALAEADGMGRLTDVNSRFCALLGTSRQDLLGGMSFLDLTMPEDMPESLSLFQAEVDRRAATSRHEQRYLRSDGTTFWGATHLALSYGEDGRVTHIVAALQDISDRRAAEAQHALLVLELDHRAKNLLAVVQAVVRLTPKSDPSNYVAAIEGRLAALAHVHNLLAEDHWQGASLGRLAAAELAGFQAEDSMPASPRIVLDGPAVQLQPAAAQGLAMVLHELATNAVKHGALSAPGGQVLLRWRVDSAAGLLRLQWLERGGPDVAGAPARLGFGTRLINSTLRDQLGGTVEKSWAPGGMVCVVALPIGRAVAA